MNSNPMMAILNMMKNGGNPEQIVLSMLQERAAGNPMLETLLQLAQQGDTQGVERIARNVVNEKGGNFDQQFNNFRKTFGV